MKRYISAILVPCMLLQLYGCSYTAFSEITLEELKNQDSSHNIKIKTNQDEFITEESGKYTYDWEAGDSSITIIKKGIFSGNVTILLDSTQIKYNEIQKIEIEKRENYNELEVTGIVLASLAIVGFMIFWFSNEYSKNFWK